MKNSLYTKDEIGVWLDSYDDLFSDFDPRPYELRALSDDFIAQVKKIAKGHPGSIKGIKLLLPQDVRNDQYEKLIAKHLHAQFQHNYGQIRSDISKTTKKGLFLTVLGITFMILASFISFGNPESFFLHGLQVLTEPAGWFLLWLGLDHLFYFSKKAKKDINFYALLSEIKIGFGTY